MILLSVLWLASFGQTEVCIEGYVMDVYCIDLGFLLDNSGVETLVGPDQHSVHCLVDIDVCYESGFEILSDPEPGSNLHCRAFRLNSAADQDVIDFARAQGTCDTCTGAGSQQKGLRATVFGTVAPNQSASPPVMEVTRLDVAGVGCGSTPAATIDMCLVESGGAGDAIPPHAICMIVAWAFMLPAGAVIAKFGKHRDPLWFKLHKGIQPLGLLVAIVGVIIALRNFNVFETSGWGASKVHGTLGLTIMTLGILQPLNAMLRPHPTPRTARTAWEYLHKGSGWIALSLAAGNMILGTRRTPGPTPYQIFIGAGLGGTCVLAVYLIADGLGYWGSADSKPDSVDKGPANDNL